MREHGFGGVESRLRQSWFWLSGMYCDLLLAEDVGPDAHLQVVQNSTQRKHWSAGTIGTSSNTSLVRRTLPSGVERVLDGSLLLYIAVKT